MNEQRHPVEVLAEEFVTRRRAGERPEIAEYAKRHPEHAAAIEALFPAMLALEDVPVRVATSSPPRQLGDLRIVREIGRGGMGVVYEAVQESLQRSVAVKVLPAIVEHDHGRSVRFRREAETVARLHHTNIVPIFATGEAEGQPYYVMPWIKGVPLDQVVARLGDAGLSVDARAGSGAGAAEVIAWLSRGGNASGHGAGAYCRGVAELGVQVAGALTHAHAHGVLHRDIKPANLLVDANGTVWVTDFGLAKTIGHEALTASTDAVGTLTYMAPEQLRGTSDARSDVYGLGLVLWELVARRRAFGDADRRRGLRDALQGLVPRLAKVAPDTPTDLATIIDKACASEPKQRYATAADLAADLGAFLADRPIAARPAGPIAVAWRWCRRNRALAAMAALAGAGLVIAAAVGWLGWVATTAALGRETVQADQARQASERAAATLRLTLAAFDEVFDELCGPDALRDEIADPETGDSAMVAVATVSARDLELLERLLAFYARFADSHAADQALRAETIKAYRRVGDIQARLGRSQAAEAAYRSALAAAASAGALADGFEAALVERAAAHNQLGRCLRAADRRTESTACHQAALTLLTARPEDSLTPAERFELARTLSLLGSPPEGDPARRGPRRRPPQEHLPRRLGKPRGAEDDAALQRRALAVLAPLCAAQPDSLRVRLLAAHCQGLLADALIVLRSPDANDERERALTALRGLVREAPGRPEPKLELAEALVRFARPGPPPATIDPTADSCAEEAVALLEQLVAAEPAVPSYRTALAYAIYRRALLLRRQDPPAARAGLQRAIAMADEALTVMPGDHGTLSCLSWSTGALAGQLEADGQLPAAREVHHHALQALTKVQPVTAERRRWIVKHWDAVALICQRLGDRTAAEEARRAAEALAEHR